MLLLILLINLFLVSTEINENVPLKYTIKSKSGQIIQTGMVFNGKRDGQWIVYYDNGEIKTIANYNLGKKNGKWSHFNYDGSLLLIVIYDNDTIVSYKKIE